MAAQVALEQVQPVLEWAAEQQYQAALDEAYDEAFEAIEHYGVSEKDADQVLAEAEDRLATACQQFGVNDVDELAARHGERMSARDLAHYAIAIVASEYHDAANAESFYAGGSRASDRIFGRPPASARATRVG